MSTNNGTNWTAKNNGIQSESINLIGFDGTNIFAGTSQDLLYVSIDSGDNWLPVNMGILSPGPISYVLKGSEIFVGADEGMFISSDHGNSWIKINNGLTYNAEKIISIDTNIYVGCQNGFFIFNRNDSSWIAMNNGLTNFNIHSLLVYGANILAGTHNGESFSCQQI